MRSSPARARPPPPRNRPADVSPATKLLAGVELGGTKCVCILGTGPDDVRAVERLPTGEREETLRQIEAVLDRWRSQHGAARALGIASFGPVDLRADSPTYGFITSTTKPGWRNTDVAQRLGRRVGAPGGFRHRRERRGTRRRALGRGGGPRRLRVRHGGHRHRRRHHRARQVGVRHEPHRARTHSRGAQAGRQISRHLPVSWRLHRRTGLGSRHRSARRHAGLATAARSSGLGFRRARPRPTHAHHGADHRAVAHLSRRRRDERADASVRTHSAGTQAQPQSLRRSAGARAGSRAIHRSSGSRHDGRAARRAGARGRRGNRRPRSIPPLVTAASR